MEVIEENMFDYFLSFLGLVFYFVLQFILGKSCPLGLKESV